MTVGLFRNGSGAYARSRTRDGGLQYKHSRNPAVPPEKRTFHLISQPDVSCAKAQECPADSMTSMKRGHDRHDTQHVRAVTLTFTPHKVLHRGGGDNSTLAPRPSKASVP